MRIRISCIPRLDLVKVGLCFRIERPFECSEPPMCCSGQRFVVANTRDI